MIELIKVNPVENILNAETSVNFTFRSGSTVNHPSYGVKLFHDEIAEAESILKSNGKVACVKYIKETGNTGLLESKRIADYIEENMI